MDPHDPTSSLDLLNRWKQIAAYVGKSVRAAQRWEREMGLPVRRLKTASSQIIYASKREIDAWRRQLEVEPGGGVPAGKRAPGAHPADPAAASKPPVRLGRIRLAWLWAVIATLATLAFLAWFW